MAELINSGKVIQKPEIVVDPSIFLPGGIVGARSKRGDEVKNPDDSYVSGSGNPAKIIEGAKPTQDDGTGSGTTTTGPAPSRGIIPPTGFSVISQTPKFGADGSMTVDVVIQFEDIEGATGYDVRLTKGGESEGILVPVGVTP